MTRQHPSTAPARWAVLCALMAACALAPAGCTGRPAADDANPAADRSPAAEAALEPAGPDAAQPDADFAAEMEHGRRLERSGDADQARDLYRRLADRSPDRYEPLRRLGILADRAGRFDQAREFYTRAIRLRPGDPELLNDLGYSLFLDGKLDEAERELLKAVVLAPADPRSHNNLGLVYGHTGRYQEALEQFLSAGSEADAHYNLGSVLASMGNYAAAKQCFDRALACDPNHKLALKALHELRKLEDAANQAGPGQPAGASEPAESPAGSPTRTAEAVGRDRATR